jgi:hypothetical protein
VESNLDDYDLKDYIDHLKGMVDYDEDDDCGCCDCDGSCDDTPKFPCRITCSDDDEDPIDIELSLDALNVILDKTNRDGCSFNDAFCAILQEYLDLVTKELDLEDDEDDEDTTGKDAFGF